MPSKSFPWRKPTPAQVNMIERLFAAGGALRYFRLVYKDIVVLDELKKLGFVEIEIGRRVALTEAGHALRAASYRTDRVMVAVTKPQLDVLWFLAHAGQGTESGVPASLIPGHMIDVCRRMTIRGWAERYEDWSRRWWTRITESGLEVLEAIQALDDAMQGAAVARANGRLH